MKSIEHRDSSGQKGDRPFIEPARILDNSRRLRERLQQERTQRQHETTWRQLQLVQSSLIKAQSYLLIEHYHRLLKHNKTLNLEFQYLLKTECLSAKAPLYPLPPPFLDTAK